MNPPSRATASQLINLLSPAENPQRLWGAEELGAVWRHQLAAALEFDLGGLAEPFAAQLRGLSTPAGCSVRTFADLLLHPFPPLELLELVKEFGKTHSTHPDSLLPREISMTLYYAGIAAALVKSGRRISSLPPSTLRQGLDQVSRFEWLDQQTRALIQRAVSLL